MNQSSHIWMSHVTHSICASLPWTSRTRTRVNESCHIWMRQVKHESHLNWSSFNNQGQLSHETEICFLVSATTCSVMSHMNELFHARISRLTHEWVMSHTIVPLLTCVTYEWVESHMNQSCLAHYIAHIIIIICGQIIIIICVIKHNASTDRSGSTTIMLIDLIYPRVLWHIMTCMMTINFVT